MLGLCFGFARRPARPGPLFFARFFPIRRRLGRASARFGEGNAAARPSPAQTSPPRIRAAWPRFVFSSPPPIPPAPNCFGAPSRFLFDCFRCALRGRFSFRSVPLFPLCPLFCFIPFRAQRLRRFSRRRATGPNFGARFDLFLRSGFKPNPRRQGAKRRAGGERGDAGAKRAMKFSSKSCRRALEKARPRRRVGARNALWA